MTAPKSKGTKSKRDKRRLHIFLKKPNLIECKKCSKLILPHTVCPFCGYYKNKQVINVIDKKEKKEEKKEEKEKAKEEMKKPLDVKELSKK